MQVRGTGALITGGASGLGAATARRLHAAGALVTIFDRDADKAASLVDELGDGAAAFAGDVTSEADTLGAIAAATDRASLGIVVAVPVGPAAGAGRSTATGNPTARRSSRTPSTSTWWAPSTPRASPPRPCPVLPPAPTTSGASS